MNSLGNVLLCSDGGDATMRDSAIVGSEMGLGKTVIALKNIRRLQLLNLSKSKDEARIFMKELSASEELGEKYRSQLKKLFFNGE